MKPARLLIVEDERISRLTLRHALEALGYEVVAEAETAWEAISRTEQLLPDLVLMDINLQAEGDGIAATEDILQRLQIPVVYLSGSRDDPILQRARQTGAYGFLVKPPQEAALKVTLETALQRARLDRQLREGEQWLLALISSVGDGVIATDPEGRVVLLNAGAEVATGWTQAEALGRDYREIFVLQSADGASPDLIRLALSSGKAINLDALPSSRDETGRVTAYFLLRKDGQRLRVDCSATPIRTPRRDNRRLSTFEQLAVSSSDEVIGAVLLVKDISEREKLAETLVKMQKMEAVGRLAGGIAHDFNNLLTIINGLAEFLVAGVSTEEARRHGQDILRAGERAASLTRQLLAFAGKHTTAQKVLDLNVVVRDLMPQLRTLLRQSVSLHFEPSSKPVLVSADPVLLERVLLTLASNASDAMPHGGTLLIQVDTAPRKNPEQPAVAPLPSLPEPTEAQDWPRLRVRDSGIGIPPERREHLFEPYFGAGEEIPAGGLALAAVYGIVQQHHGTIEVDSQFGVGTTFTISLPPVRQVEPVAGSLTGWSATTRKTRTILLVDDEEMVRKLAKTVLESAGYTVLEAASGEEALQLADSYSDVIDLLITDVIMPVINGRVLHERLAQQRPGLPVLYMSGYTNGALQDMGLLPADIDLLTKPFSLIQFRQRVADLIARS
jgi:two-component system cell cycle sensor histidine kinase/response regulator CckA